MQKYPLCQEYKYPALSFRSLFLFSFFLSVFFFLAFFVKRSVFYALPELSALSLAVTVASQQESWVPCTGAVHGCCAWVPPEGLLPGEHPLPGAIPLYILPEFLAAHQPGKADTKAGARKIVAKPAWHCSLVALGGPLNAPTSRTCVSAGMGTLPQKHRPRSGRTNGHTPAEPQRSHVFCPHRWYLLAMARVQSSHKRGGKPSGRAPAGTRCRQHPRARHPDLPQKGLEPGCGCSLPAAPQLGLELRLPRCLFKQYWWQASRSLRSGAGAARRPQEPGRLLAWGRSQSSPHTPARLLGEGSSTRLPCFSFRGGCQTPTGNRSGHTGAVGGAS